MKSTQKLLNSRPNKYPMDEFGMFNSSSIKASLKDKLKEKNGMARNFIALEDGKESPLKISDPEVDESPHDAIPDHFHQEEDLHDAFHHEEPHDEELHHEDLHHEELERDEISGDGIIPDDLDYAGIPYGDINDFVNANIQEEPEDQDYKRHIKNLFENRPLSIDVDQEENAPKVVDELDLDSLSNHALESKQVESKEKSKLAELFSKSNFPEKDSIEGDLKGEEEKERLPGTVPDLEPDLQQYKDELVKFDSNVEDFIKNPSENMIPDNFGEMLEGDNPDMEKVVNFSTLNSQDQVNEDVEINKGKIDPKENEIEKFEYFSK